jgi:hypothetical protein
MILYVLRKLCYYDINEIMKFPLKKKSESPLHPRVEVVGCSNKQYLGM